LPELRRATLAIEAVNATVVFAIMTIARMRMYRMGV
jgi:hypothetical protein